MSERGAATRPGALRALNDPVVVILLLAGSFDGLSGNPIHSVLLFAVALALGRDAALGRAEARERAPVSIRTHPRLGSIALAAAVAYSVMVGGFGRYSWPATVAVVVPAAAILGLAWRGPLRAASEPGRVDIAGALAWAAAFVGLALWELTQLLLQPSLTTDSQAHPTLSVLTDPGLATHPGRSIALLAWLAFGWFLLGR
jgi:hypothetical protein